MYASFRCASISPFLFLCILRCNTALAFFAGLSNRKSRSAPLLATDRPFGSIDEVDFGTNPSKGFQLEDALKDYWCRKPLILRNVFNTDDLESREIWPAEEDLLDLATSGWSGESARIIRHKSGRLDSFQLDLGPFDDNDIHLLERGEEAWTLLVNDVDRYSSKLADWMDDVFSTIPRWRRDDAQVSMARVGGGIGPHVDNYDVFLIQASGRRTWSVGAKPISVQEELDGLVPGIDVRILQDYPSSRYLESVVLRRGDLLYLPPRYVHCGTADTDDCRTLSVGARSPGASELFARLAEQMMTQSVANSDIVNRRYSDPLLFEKEETIFEPSLTNEAKNDMKLMVHDALSSVMGDSHLWDEFVGRLVTEPKRSVADDITQPFDQLDDEAYLARWGPTAKDALEKFMRGQGVLVRCEGVSLASSTIIDPESSQTKYRLFANGRMYEVCGSNFTEGTPMVVLCQIERGERLRCDSLPVTVLPGCKHLLAGLIADGVLYMLDNP